MQDLGINLISLSLKVNNIQIHSLLSNGKPR